MQLSEDKVLTIFQALFHAQKAIKKYDSWFATPLSNGIHDGIYFEVINYSEVSSLIHDTISALDKALTEDKENRCVNLAQKESKSERDARIRANAHEMYRILSEIRKYWNDYNLDSDTEDDIRVVLNAIDGNEEYDE